MRAEEGPCGWGHRWGDVRSTLKAVEWAVQAKGPAYADTEMCRDIVQEVCRTAERGQRRSRTDPHSGLGLRLEGGEYMSCVWRIILAAVYGRDEFQTRKKPSW